jgi:hypothetical protein
LNAVPEPSTVLLLIAGTVAARDEEAVSEPF